MAVLVDVSDHRVGFDVVDGGVADGEFDLAAGGEAGGDQVFQHLVLGVDGDVLAAGEAGEVDAVAVSVDAQLEAAMLEALAGEAVAEAGLHHEVDGALFEHTGADGRLDGGAGAVFDDDAVDAFEVEEVGEHEAGRTGADDANLGLRPFNVPLS